MSTTVLEDRGADPDDLAPLGLAALALTLFLFGANMAGWMSNSRFGGVFQISWLAVATIYGGFVQFLAGMWEFRYRNVLGSTAFSSLGAFWIATAFISGSVSITPGDVGWFYFGWMVFVLMLAFAALRTNAVVLSVFGLFALMLFCLWISVRSGDHPGSGWLAVSGYIAVIASIAAWYATLAALVNAVWREPTIPTFPLGRRLSTPTRVQPESPDPRTGTAP